MPPAKKLVSEVWCPRCKCYVGKIYEVEFKDHHYKHVTVPKVLPKECSMCEGVVERKK